MRASLSAFAAAIAFAACSAGADAAASCSMTLPATINVGNYDPTILNSSVTVTFGLSYTCDPGASASNLSISASIGAYSSGATFDKRNMKAGGADSLNYWLYPPGYSVTPHSSANVWGDGSSTSRVWGPFAPVNGTVYNGTGSLQVDGNQDVAGGSYSDSVVFTMSFV
ncbi:MAG: Spore Coat Protein domain [Candidatus Eremiobacteraeota bacterium]|nr:Spore Coat Protein domain [Candidatus Eremiobacteraeota bacterium]